jgi:Radical SAM superfamily
MIEIPNLEFHAAHACNLYCAQCSHYSNFHAGGIVSVDEASANFDAWQGRLAPKQIAILGGEPTLNPELLQIIELARRAFPDSRGLFVTNGFFLDRHPDLPRALLDNGFRMDVSQHGNSPAYRKQFTEVLQRLEEWRAAYPALKITVRESHKGWRQQYRMIDGKPMPFDCGPKAAWEICLQRSCTQLFKGHLGNAPLSHTSQLWSENFAWTRYQRGSSFVTIRHVHRTRPTLRSWSSLRLGRFPSVVYVQLARSRSITRTQPSRINNDEASDCGTRLATPP